MIDDHAPHPSVKRHTGVGTLSIFMHRQICKVSVNSYSAHLTIDQDT